MPNLPDNSRNCAGSMTPQPARVVHVCDDIACRIKGAEKLCADMEASGVAWKRSPCLGQCENAPAALLKSPATPLPTRMPLATLPSPSTTLPEPTPEAWLPLPNTPLPVNP